jgi:hypothetical protein
MSILSIIIATMRFGQEIIILLIKNLLINKITWTLVYLDIGLRIVKFRIIIIISFF